MFIDVLEERAILTRDLKQDQSRTTNKHVLIIITREHTHLQTAINVSGT